MSAAPPPAPAPEPARSRDPRTPGTVAARILGAAALVTATFVVLRPFFIPMLWAAILAYLTWPLYLRLAARTRHRELSAAAFATLVALGLGIPVALVLLSVANDASNLASAALEWQRAGAPLPDWLAQHAIVQRVLAFARESDLASPERLSDLAAAGGSWISGQVVSLAGGLARNAFKFGVMVVLLYGFYVSGERIVELGRRLAPILFPIAPARFVESIGESVRAVMVGVTGTAVAQGTFAGIGMAFAGVPSPVFFGALTSLTAVLPGGGSAVSLLAAGWLALQGRYGAAIGLALWAALVVGMMDNILRPLLISGRAPIPFLVVFVGILGGLTAFGMIGIFLGPVLLSVAFTLLNEFARLARAGDGGEAA
jgi:predicted PurR-regulated permease PerM